MLERCGGSGGVQWQDVCCAELVLRLFSRTQVWRSSLRFGAPPTIYAIYLCSTAPGEQCDKADTQLAKGAKAMLGISEVGAALEVSGCSLHLVSTDGILIHIRQRLPRQEARVRIVALNVVCIRACAQLFGRWCNGAGGDSAALKAYTRKVEAMVSARTASYSYDCPMVLVAAHRETIG